MIQRRVEMRKYIIFTLLSFISLAVSAQEKIGSNLEIDKSIHDFGDVMIDDGPVSCAFTVKNIGQTPAVIYNVVSSCGCTDVKWTREPLKPGDAGKISVTYSNDEGPYPFDKTLTVYFSDVKKPYILKVRGTVHEKKKSLEELYPVRFGSLGIKEAYIKCGNLEQGGMRSDFVNVANLTEKPMKIEFKDINENLSVKVTPNPIPPRSTAELEFTIKASRDKWGKNDYHVTPLINGKEYTSSEGKKSIGFWAFTKEDFKGLSEEEKSKGPRPMFESSTWSSLTVNSPLSALLGSFGSAWTLNFTVYLYPLSSKISILIILPSVLFTLVSFLSRIPEILAFVVASEGYVRFSSVITRSADTVSCLMALSSLGSTCHPIRV